MLKNRIVTAIWAIPVLSLIIWFGEPYFTIAAAVIGLLAAIEFFRLTKEMKAQTLAIFGIVWTVLIIIARDAAIINWLAPHFDTGLLIPGIVTSGMVISLILLLTRKQKSGAFADWSWTLAEILYIGWFLGYFVALRGLGGSGTTIGRNWVFLAIFTSFGCDSAAYFIGRAFGKHKMAPEISPKKSWEGCVGGLFGAVLVSLFFVLNTPLSVNQYLNWWQLVIIGLLVSVFGQLGDLVESLFKRNTGVKDSGNLFPGHGGMLDRIDSLVFAAIVVYYAAVLFKLY
jgi:phosphatidate cytidylyltransferase